MAKYLHVICEKCGSDDITFKTEYCGCNDCGCQRSGGWVTAAYCADCATRTTTEEWNERNGKVKDEKSSNNAQKWSESTCREPS